MNKSLNEYLDFSFELNIELNDFLALFSVWMNNQNLLPRAKLRWTSVRYLGNLVSSFQPGNANTKCILAPEYKITALSQKEILVITAWDKGLRFQYYECHMVSSLSRDKNFILNQNLNGINMLSSSAVFSYRIDTFTLFSNIRVKKIRFFLNLGGEGAWRRIFFFHFVFF